MKKHEIDIIKIIIDEFDKIELNTKKLDKKIDEFMRMLDEKQKKKFLELDALYNSVRVEAQDYMAEFSIEFIKRNLRTFFKMFLDC